MKSIYGYSILLCSTLFSANLYGQQNNITSTEDSTTVVRIEADRSYEQARAEDQLKQLKADAKKSKEEAREARRVDRQKTAEAREAKRALKAEKRAQKARRRADRLARKADKD